MPGPGATQSMAEEDFQESHGQPAPTHGKLTDGWLVVLLSLVFGGLLAWVYVALGPRIEQNKADDTLGAVPSLVPGAVKGSDDSKVVVGSMTVYRATDKDGKQIGWVVPGSGQGFADRIELLVGLDLKADRLTGLYVLAQTETPGLGDNIRSDAWRAQFAGKEATEPIEVTKSSPAGNEIQAITGATVSSMSVTGIVNATVQRFRQALAGAASKTKEADPNG